MKVYCNWCKRIISGTPTSLASHLDECRKLYRNKIKKGEEDMKVFKKLLSSRKFVATLVGLLVAIGAKVGLSEELGSQIAWMVVIIIGTYVGAQGLADFGKEKVEGTSGSVTISSSKPVDDPRK